MQTHELFDHDTLEIDFACGCQAKFWPTGQRISGGFGTCKTHEHIHCLESLNNDAGLLLSLISIMPRPVGNA